MQRKIAVILDNIRSRENVGSIFRTADAVGVSAIYLCGITPQPPHEKIRKTALGAEETTPWEYHKDTWRVMEKLKKEGYRVLALEKTIKSQDLFSKGMARTNGNLAIILGNEVNGISGSIIKRADLTISIPMLGSKESLNVAIAFSVIAYQLVFGSN